MEPIKEENSGTSRRSFLNALGLGVASLSLPQTFQACKKADPVDERNEESGGGAGIFRIAEVQLLASYAVVRESAFTVLGKGFKEGDELVFKPQAGQGENLLVMTASVYEASAIFMLPSALQEGKYLLEAKRGARTQVLGTTNFSFVLRDNEDREGMTIKGVVHVGGNGLADVVVSDGFEVTKTDQNGVYYLPSAKKAGYVFISVPGNYEVLTKNGIPQFFQRLVGGPQVEVRDFELFPVNNDKHVVVTMTDIHLANRLNDLSQFQSGFLNDVNNLIASYQATGTKVYGLSLGDLTTEQFWYSNNFKLKDSIAQLSRMNIPIFHTMGNHDNDPYVADDWLAEDAFRQEVGPTYYSFNIGKVHYIVLDNEEYVNTGGAQGVLGSMTSRDVIVQEQIAWLEKDLATISDKNTPIVVAMHAPLYTGFNMNTNPSYNLTGGSVFRAALNAFANVKVLTGHWHINFRHEVSPSLVEYNVGAVCASWWWTGRNGYSNNHICRDGSPGGYGIWEMDGTSQSWYYKSIGYEREYQFRSYDLNEVHITAETHTPNANTQYKGMVPNYVDAYGNKRNDNEVLINVWGYDKYWKVEVTENGNPLEVTRVAAKDPLHIISYSMQMLNHNSTPNSALATSTPAHMFKAKASGATSALQIRVTDRFGNVYTEDMQRPKAFNYAMR